VKTLARCLTSPLLLPTALAALLLLSRPAGAQLEARHLVRRDGPASALASLDLANRGPDPFRILVVSFVGPPAELVAVLPPPLNQQRVGDGTVSVVDLGTLAPGAEATVLVRVALSSAREWAHAVLLDAENVRTGARVCERRDAPVTETAVPFADARTLVVLALALGAALWWKTRRP
jgi:hypothetical protein